MPDEPRVVVAGAGFGGLEAARTLEGRARVTVVNPRDTFTFRPLVHELLSEESKPRDVGRPISEKTDADLVEDRVERVKDGALALESGDVLEFDQLVVAVGAEPHYFGVPGAEDHGLPFWTLADGLEGNRALKRLAADGPPDGRDRVQVTVAGAGLTGLEVATEAAAFLEAYDVPYAVHVPEMREELFPDMDPAFGREVHEGLKRYNVRVLLGTAVEEIHPDRVDVNLGGDEKTLPSDVTFWCTGVKPRVVEPLSMTVDETLRSIDREDTWIVGDCARYPDELGAARLAQVAVQAGERAAENLLDPAQARAFQPSTKGTILSLGPGYAVAQVGDGTVLSGRIPWHVKKQLYKWKLGR